MANLICAKCNEIVDEQNAVECPFCWEIYHKECWEDTENCVTCRKYNPIYEIAQAQKELEAQNQEKEEQENKNINNVIEDEDFTETVTREMPSSPVANMVLLASMVVIGVGVAGGLALGVYMYFANKLLVGILGGVAIVGLGFVLSLVIKGVAEMVNNSQKNAYYLSKLVKMVEDEE
ncbi:MAG: hypothetical protein IKU41_08565 [Clostridia bacterium]|nr:hypothetical protein [Clostridia bacterium]